METHVEQTFTATADGGRQITIEVVRGRHQILGNMREPGPQWVPDAICTLRTSDGQEVYPADENDGEFRVAGSNVVYRRN